MDNSINYLFSKLEMEYKSAIEHGDFITANDIVAAMVEIVTLVDERIKRRRAELMRDIFEKAFFELANRKTEEIE